MNFWKKYGTRLAALMAVLALMTVLFVGCGGDSDKDTAKQTAGTTQAPETTENTLPDDTVPPETTAGKWVRVIVVHSNGEEAEFSYITETLYLGDLLLEKGLIEGEGAESGMQITSVNEEVAIPEENGAYWEFFVNDSYASATVDQTVIEDGAIYTFNFTYMNVEETEVPEGEIPEETVEPDPVIEEEIPEEDIVIEDTEPTEEQLEVPET